jgi:hypothetical protein
MLAAMSGEPSRFSGKDLERWLASRRRYKSKPGPRATLGDLQWATPWVWLWCERCHHRSPLACAVVVIRWGAGASSDVLRERARCMACGNKGATLQRPSWEGERLGFQPFPR